RTRPPTACAGFSEVSPSAASNRHRWRAGFRRCASFIASFTRRVRAATIRPQCSKGQSAHVRCRRCFRSPTSTSCSRWRAPIVTMPNNRFPNACAPRGCFAFWHTSMLRECTRRFALLQVFSSSALRVSELVALPAAAARRDQHMLIVRGKGAKERLVPLNKEAKSAMGEYLELRSKAERDKDTKWLFPSFGEQGHLTRQHFARELKALGAAS